MTSRKLCVPLCLVKSLFQENKVGTHFGDPVPPLSQSQHTVCVFILAMKLATGLESVLGFMPSYINNTPVLYS